MEYRSPWFARFSAYHTLFFNNGVARFWGGIQGPMTEVWLALWGLIPSSLLWVLPCQWIRPCSKEWRQIPLQDTPPPSWLSMTSVSVWIVLWGMKSLEMTEFNYQELSLLLREKGYHEKGIQFIEKLFRVWITDPLSDGPSTIRPSASTSILVCVATPLTACTPFPWRRLKRSNFIVIVRLCSSLRIRSTIVDL